MMHNLSYENEFYSQVYFHANQTHFHLNGFRTWTRFETEAKGNSELAYYITPKIELFNAPEK